MIKKTRLISNFITSQTGKQTIVIYNCNISRNKANQTMEFCEFIEYSMRNIFLEESYRKEDVMEKLVPDPFLENLN